jgi:uncharacterized phage-associated protein
MAMKIYAARDIANYLLSRADAEDNDISNMKLQKLCYYAQAYCTSMRGAPLFGESLYAWDHGPVVEQLYHEYKKHGRDPIPVVTDFDESKIDEPDRIALNDIFDHFNQFSAWHLRGMTHEEPPWADAYKRGVQGSEISVGAMVDFFGPQIADDYVKRVYGGQVQKGASA